MKVLYNEDRYVLGITGTNYSATPDIEVTNPEIFGEVTHQLEVMKWGCFIYTVIYEKGGIWENWIWSLSFSS